MDIYLFIEWEIISNEILFLANYEWHTLYTWNGVNRFASSLKKCIFLEMIMWNASNKFVVKIPPTKYEMA